MMIRLVIGMVLLLAATTAGAQDGPDRITIPHGLHFENDVACLDCHGGVDESTSAADTFRPEMDVCADCHDIGDEDLCAGCHTNVDEAGDYAEPAYGAANFPHAAHVARGVDCAACHGDPAADQPVLPAKIDCRACHDTADDYGDCRICHAEGDDLVPASHGSAWSARHGLEALENPQACALCHTEVTCQDCHAGDNVRPRSHPLNYAFSHALDARGNEHDCAVCHQEPEYCSSCHVAERVLPRSHSEAGWLRSPDGGRHAEDGLFEIESCIACHDDGAGSPTCARCHGG